MSAVEPNLMYPGEAFRLPPVRIPPERVGVIAVIIAMHVLAVGAIWTRKMIVKGDPLPLVVNLLDAEELDVPSPEPLVDVSIAPPPVALALPVPIEIAEEPAPTAITVKELPPQPQPVAPVASSLINEARFDVDYLNNPKPAYPPMSRRLREEGVVLLKVNVRADGSVANALVEMRSGSQRLDDAALDVVKRWHFVPARRGNDAVESWVLVPIEFALQS